MSIYTGFVYIWYDRKRKWFCIGSHMGSLDDGYTSSTGFMKKAYKKRPNDFKRKILEFYYGNDSKELFSIEQKYLDMIKDTELCLGENKITDTVRYYNVKKKALGISGIAASVIKKNYWNSELGRMKKIEMSSYLKGNTLGSKRLGMTHTEETKMIISKSRVQNKLELTEEQRNRKSERSKELWTEPEYLEKMRNRKSPDYEKISDKMRGRTHDEETKARISESLLGKQKTEEHKLAMKVAAKTRNPFTCPHCGFQGRGGHRYHFNNCKSFPK